MAEADAVLELEDSKNNMLADELPPDVQAIVPIVQAKLVKIQEGAAGAACGAQKPAKKRAAPLIVWYESVCIGARGEQP